MAEVFIFYSSKDQTFREELADHLEGLTFHSIDGPFVTDPIDWWSDDRLAPGSLRGDELFSALNTCRIALLLVSKNFLASDFIANEELPKIFDRIRNQDGLKIFWVLLSPCAWQYTPIADYSAISDLSKPLSSLRSDNRNKFWSQVLIPEIRKELAKELETTPKQSKKLESKEDRFFFISHAKEDGDFAENLKRKLEDKSILVWIDTDYMAAGEKWRDKIDNAIKACEAVILVISPDSMNSQYVTYEWSYGLGREKPVIPLLLKAAEFHPRLEEYQYLDFSARQKRPWDQLIKQLMEY